MIIPAIDFQGGHVVQLVQGERTALERELDPTLAWLEGFPWLQIIDLDAAKGEGDNSALVRRCCRAGFRVRVGGGIRTLERARAVLADGAEQVILGSAVFREGAPDLAFLESLQPVGREHLMLAVDAREGRVATHGWRQRQPLTAVEAVRQLEPYAGGFLYTHVDTEGLMQGIPLAAVEAVRAETQRPLSVAGGIATEAQIDALTRLGCDCILGMALYTGRLDIAALRAAARTAAS